MKLYAKHLTSLADLKRERYLMKYARQVHHADDLFSFDKPKGKKKRKKHSDDEDDDNSGGLMGMATKLFGLSPAASGLLGNKQVRKFVINRIPRKTIGRIGWEVLGGYLKWKAIELSYGLIRDVVRKRREKARLQKISDAYEHAQVRAGHQYQRATRRN